LSESVDLKAYATPMISVEDARSIAHEVELGAHSFEHASLSLESDSYIRDDAEKCRKFFNEELCAKTDIYALPNGDGAARATPILKAAGYHHILLTDEKHSSPERHEHPRFTMEGTSSAEIRFRSTGFVRN
jgi:hypothetical protein